LQQTCIDVLLELQEAIFSKKNRNVLGTHGDFVNEVFSRQADLAANQWLSALVSAVGTAKTAYLRGEASRVLAGFVNRGKALQPHSRAELLRQLPVALGHIATALSLLSEAPPQQQQIRRRGLGVGQMLLMECALGPGQALCGSASLGEVVFGARIRKPLVDSNRIPVGGPEVGEDHVLQVRIQPHRPRTGAISKDRIDGGFVIGKL
jgi:hypothetical protein